METGSTPPGADRRGFLKRAAAAILSGVLVLPAAFAGLRVFLDPLRRGAGGKSAVLVATLAALPEDGRPRRFPVVMSRSDAWTRVTEAVGAVYLRRTEGGGVVALHASCPHAGCSVDFRAGSGAYLCPCHNSSFGLDGAIADQSSPSPRGMDQLEVEVRGGAEVWVKFENYRAGETQKVPVT